MGLLHTSARAMLSAIFVTGGARSLVEPDALVPAAKKVTDHVTPVLEKSSARLPTDTRTLVQVNAAVQLVGGLLLMTPLRRPAALVLAASLVPTTLAGHPFWQHEDPGERAGQQVHFLKNVGLFGGLLLAATHTEGRPGVRWRAGHLARHANRSLRRTTSGGSRSLRRAARGSSRPLRRATH
jgi:putative oxidoreductase